MKYSLLAYPAVLLGVGLVVGMIPGRATGEQMADIPGAGLVLLSLTLCSAAMGFLLGLAIGEAESKRDGERDR